MKNNTGLFIMVGLALIALALFAGVKTFKGYDRTVSVRGLCEKEVMADQAIWPIAYKIAGNDLQEMIRDINAKNNAVVDFLVAGGISKDDISVNAPVIVDCRTNAYTDVRAYNYIITSSITVCTSDVQKVVDLSARQIELVQKGIPVGSAESWEYQTIYSFNGLNEIKPEMIEEATKNARAAAEKFAKDSGSRLGKIKTASQGQFSIENRDSNTPYIKNVRVVTGVVYYIRG